MKNIFLKSIALTLLATSGLVCAQINDANRPFDQQSKPTNNETIPFPSDGQNPEKGFIPGQVYYLYFPASVGAPISQTADKAYWGAGCVYMGASSGLDVSLQLPDGHSIRGFRYFWDDNSAGSTAAVLFDFDGAGGFTNIHRVDSTGDTGFGSDYQNLAGGDVVVDNWNNAYTIRFTTNEGNSSQRMCGVRIAMVAP